MSILDEVASALADEGDQLEEFLGRLEPQAWRQPTPSPGWAVADQVAHLAWTDAVAIVAMTDPEGFALLQRGQRAVEDPQETAGWDPARLLTHWSAGRHRLAAGLFDVAAGRRIPWFGPPMSPTSMATARLMETWAHGADIRAAFGEAPTAGPHLRHVAHIGVITRNFAYATHGLEPPGEEVLVSLVGPDGEVWTWGPDTARESVRGSALDFCLVVTRRRHVDDTGLEVSGPGARQWMEVAQAFAGPPGPPPARHI